MKGFTLIELIIYIGIVTVILLVMFNFSWEIIYGNVKSQAIREVQQNSRFCMEKIVRNILAASKINLPRPGNSSNKLQLKMTDPGLNPTIFRLSDGVLTIKQGVNGPYELINDRVRIANLQFTNLSYVDTPGAVRVEMTIDHVNPAGRGEYEASFTLKSTASLVAGGAGIAEEGFCQGTPTACSSFGDQTSCENQGGCSWIPGSCGGTCTSCSRLDFLDCIFQDGCNWNWRRWKCKGHCTDCDDYDSQGFCESQLGCSWATAYCSGTVTPCENFTTETTCVSQDRCQWITP